MDYSTGDYSGTPILRNAYLLLLVNYPPSSEGKGGVHGIFSVLLNLDSAFSFFFCLYCLLWNF